LGVLAKTTLPLTTPTNNQRAFDGIERCTNDLNQGNKQSQYSFPKRETPHLIQTQHGNKRSLANFM